MFEEIRYIQKSLQQKQIDFDNTSHELSETQKRHKLIEQSYKQQIFNLEDQNQYHNSVILDQK